MISGVRVAGWLGWLLMAWGCVGGLAWGQTLAHKNWQGSGMSVEAWWARALFCDAGGDLKLAADEMDALGKMGCDAVDVAPGRGYGAASAMEGVIDEAGRRKMRVVVHVGGADDEVVGEMGFWGARGAAGFALDGPVSGRVRQAAGGRLVIGEGGQLRRVPVPEGDAAALRGWMAANVAGRQRAGMLLTALRPGYARVAMAMLSGEAAETPLHGLLGEPAERQREFSADEMLLWLPKQDSAGGGLREWVEKLSGMRAAGARGGSVVTVNFDAAGVVGWTFGGRLVVCNVSGKAVTVAVEEGLRAAGVQGAVVLPGPKTIILEPDRVFVGEIR